MIRYLLAFGRLPTGFRKCKAQLKEMANTGKYHPIRLNVASPHCWMAPPAERPSSERSVRQIGENLRWDILKIC